MTNSRTLGAITKMNYQEKYYRFNDRQAGISHVFCDETQRFFYNVFCIDMKLLKELFSVEHDFLEDALSTLNAEFGSWELQSFAVKSGCGSCAAK